MFAISIVVVLYKKHYANSISLSSLLNSLESIESAGFNAKICVWNNSPDFSPALAHPSVEWYSGENNFLPYIYNKLARREFGEGADFLMLSDDDTDYSTYNFKENLNVLAKYAMRGTGYPSAGCFIPKIYSGGRLVSPGKRFLFKGSLLKRCTPGFIKSRNVLGINSGILVTRNCYERMDPFYDERLRFYGTDTDFFIRYQDYYDYIGVLDADLAHSLSEHGQEDSDHALFRWGDNFESINIMFQDRSWLFKVVMRLYYFAVKIKLSIKFRDARFMRL